MHHPSLEAVIFSPTQSCPTKTILHIRLQTMRLPHLLPLIKIITLRWKEMHFSLCLLAKCLDKTEHVLLLPTICPYKYFSKTLNRKTDLSLLTSTILCHALRFLFYADQQNPQNRINFSPIKTILLSTHFSRKNANVMHVESYAEQWRCPYREQYFGAILLLLSQLIPHKFSVLSMLDMLSWKHSDSLCLTKMFLFVALQPLRHQNNVRLLSFPLLLRIQTSARKYTFSITEIRIPSLTTIASNPAMIPSILPRYSEADATQQPSHWSIWVAKRVNAISYADSPLNFKSSHHPQPSSELF